MVVLVCGTNLTMFPLNYMVDIVAKDWYEFVDLFCKLFFIMCDDGQQRFVKSQSFEILILWGLSLIYKAVFKYCASVLWKIWLRNTWTLSIIRYQEVSMTLPIRTVRAAKSCCVSIYCWVFSTFDSQYCTVIKIVLKILIWI